MTVADPIQAARALLERGDLEGAERSLAAAALTGGPDADRAVHALIIVCEKRGELGLRAQQALEAWLARAPRSPEDAAMRPRAQRLFADLGVDGAPLSAALPELPSLDDFAPKVDDNTRERARPRSLADVRSELDVLADSNDDAPITVRDVAAPPVAAASTSDSPLELGSAFEVGAIIKERYEVRGTLGRGGYATVMRVFDRELDEECALKIFHHSGAAADVARFKREVSLSRKIVHPNVVTLYDIGQEGSFYYLTMELLQGSDLATILQKRRKKPTAAVVNEGVEWIVEACRGLEAAHAKGVVHRDVKPGNLFLQTSGPLKVMDFGIAKPAGATSLTSAGMFVGTPQFVSPEQVYGAEVGAGADIYSLGVVAYLVVTGSLPFRDKEMLPLLMKHASEIPDAPRTRNAHVPVALDRLIMACLEKEPSDRPRSCAEVADALVALRPIAPPKPRQ